MTNWTSMADMKPPPGENVLFVWDDGVVRIGEITNYSERVQCRLDFGDAESIIYPSDDYQPVGWQWLPRPPSETE